MGTVFNSRTEKAEEKLRRELARDALVMDVAITVLLACVFASVAWAN